MVVHVRQLDATQPGTCSEQVLGEELRWDQSEGMYGRTERYVK